MVHNRDKELQTLTKPNCPSRSTAQAHDISDSVLLLPYFWSLCICKQKGCITRGKLKSWLPPPAKLDDWESCHRAVSQALDHTAVSQYHSITSWESCHKAVSQALDHTAHSAKNR